MSEKKKTRPNELDEKLFETPKKREYTLSNPTPRQLEDLEQIRNLTLTGRIFRRFEEGSLRGVVLTWMRMTMGIGILVLPNYFKEYGVIYGALLLVLAGLLNLLFVHFIFEASTYTGSTTYKELVEKLLGKRFRQIFNITILFDISFSVTIYSIVSWNLVEFLIYVFRIGEEHWDEWFLDQKTLSYNEMHPTIFAMRASFFAILYIILIPFLLKKSLGALRRVTFLYLIGLFLLLGIVLGEVPFFKIAYKDEDIGFDLRKSFDVTWIEFFFGFMMSYYIQPFVFTLRKELLMPSARRKKKIANLSIGFEILIFFIIGFFCYYALGNVYTPNLVILRKPYPNKNKISEAIFWVIIMLFFFVNSIGLPVFNTTLRNFLANLVKIKNKKVKFVFTSLTPYFIIFTVASVYPYIINLINLGGFTVCNFNGFILPVLFKIQLLRKQKKSRWKIFLCWLLVLCFASLGIAGLVFRIIK